MVLPLLIEIGVEELPAAPLLRELAHIEEKWEKILQSRSLVADFTFFYTPRRLVLWHREFLTKQPDSEVEYFGPPLDVAFADGRPTKAALSFANKCKLPVDQLSRATKNGKEVLYCKSKIEGLWSRELLGGMIKEWISSLDFGRSMRWGELNEGFIRPIRWILCMLGEEVVDCDLFGIKAANFTYPHRSFGYDPIVITHPGEYFCKIDKNGVCLYQNERRKKILDDFEQIEKSEGFVIEKDADLLDEVTAITENPAVLVGSFDEVFLKLPPEVIITSMKSHQRYFPVFKDRKLTNRFVVVSNAIAQDYSKIVAGNERVLRARLSDALFFYENDLKEGLREEGLKSVLFMDKLGSVFDKEVRELAIAMKLLGLFHERLMAETGLGVGELKALLERAVMLSKADLLTQMVYEFTELQGVMGYYYAMALGEDLLVAQAIKEQYLPVGEDSSLPSSLFSSIVAISCKLDNLMGLFSIGKVPSGKSDPFGLRRAANGIIRIVLDKNLPFDIVRVIELIKEEYIPFDTKAIEEFFMERIYAAFGINPSIVRAVIESGERDIVRLAKKIEAVAAVAQSSDFKEIFTTFKRVANITKDVDIFGDLSVDEGLFESRFEKNLYDRFREVCSKTYASYEEQLDALFGLKHELDTFFDHVLVNAEDEKLRTNRKNLVASVYKAFREVADIKEISV